MHDDLDLYASMCIERVWIRRLAMALVASAPALATSPYAVAVAPSELGFIAVAAARGELLAVCFGQSSAYEAQRYLHGQLARNVIAFDEPQASVEDEDLGADVLDRLVQYAAGDPVDFGDIAVSTDHLSPFQQRVVRACRAIGRGQTRTYGELAAAAGSPGAARAVGQVMAGNRAPLVVPCHRVVGASGSLGGFSAPQGVAMKRRLLMMESAGTR
jgi:methylated-DNA-[protein]-cysteine S-methyltransferase